MIAVVPGFQAVPRQLVCAMTFRRAACCSPCRDVVVNPVGQEGMLNSDCRQVVLNAELYQEGKVRSKQTDREVGRQC